MEELLHISVDARQKSRQEIGLACCQADAGLLEPKQVVECARYPMYEECIQQVEVS
jgi:hypothetical protein